MENILQIARDIVDKKNNRLLNDVVARYYSTVDGDEIRYWIYQNPINQRVHMPSGHAMVYKNSIVGNALINHDLGEFEYVVVNNIRRRVNHRVMMYNRTLLGDNKIVDILNDLISPYTFDNIDEFYNQLREKEEKIKELELKEKENREKRQELDSLEKTDSLRKEKELNTRELNKLKEERRILTMQQEEMNNLSRYIRQQGKLRYNPILDPIQNKIKTTHLYDGKTIVINGGPGTGKTTTMIQRLKYLIDEYAIKESFDNNSQIYKLSVSQYNLLLELIKSNKDWVFFSPSELLKQYLADAMNKEGLGNTNNKVYSWASYRKKVVRDDYGFVLMSDDTPFKFFNNRTNSRLIYDEAETINSLKNFYVDRLRQRLLRLSRIDYAKYSWAILATNIKDMFGNPKDLALDDMILKFFNVEEIYSTPAKRITDENKNNIGELVDLLLIKISHLDEDKRNTIDYIIFEQQQEDPESGAEPIIDSEEDDELSVEEKRDKLALAIKNWVKRYALKQVDESVKLSKKAEALTEILSDLFNSEMNEKLLRIGELTLFDDFAKCTRGIRTLMLSGIPRIYKDFRRGILKNKARKWDYDILEKIIKSEKQKDLHEEEQSLLLAFVNNLIRDIKLNLPNYNLRHKYVEAYEELMRPVIGIDEVTDFSIIDIAAMVSFSRTDFSSVTLCGDMMQRLTHIGLTSWDNLKYVLSDYEVVDMKTSYRQSSLLLEVAKKMYKDTLGVDADYVPYLKSTKVPKPLSYISSDEYDKIDWIEKRIKEIWRAYGNRLPAIAIFLNNKDVITSFVRELQDRDFFQNNGIDVVDGSQGNVLGSSMQVRVYPINVVKGMEFDAVFFHNIDQTNIDDDMLKKYIYVGISRAAFFLGVTLNIENDDIIKYFDSNIDWSII